MKNDCSSLDWVNPHLIYIFMQSIQLESLLQNTEFIAQQLSKIKHDIQKQVTHTSYPDVPAITYIERAIKLRQSFRSIANGIEAKRSLVQLQKEKIQKSKNFVQGLQYYKTTLINKIKESHIDVVDLHQFYDNPLEPQDWIEDYDKIEGHLKEELAQKEQKKQELQRLIQSKIQMENSTKTKKELYERVLPDRAKKIYNQVLETAKLCQIQQLESYSDIANSSLTVVYEKLNPLRINSTLQVTFQKDIYEELEITILKTGFKLYKLANLNKVGVNEREIKITIASLDSQTNRIVIGLDRREQYNNQQVFQRLINNEVVKQIYPHPKNEYERNINAKFVKVDWLQDAFLAGIITPLELINRIKERIFTLTLSSFISQNMKKLGFFFPLTSQEEMHGSFNLQSLLKRTMNGTLTKITFQEYLEQVHVPNWVEKYRLRYLEMEGQRQRLSFEGQQNFVIDKSNYLRVLNLLKLEELQESNLNNYYKGTLHVHQSRLQFVLIIPFAYPHQPSKVVITNWHHKRDEEKKLAGLEKIPCVAKINPSKNVFSQKIISFQREVNEGITQFYRDPENQPFRILLQINRLISLLGLHAQKRI